MKVIVLESISTLCAIDLTFILESYQSSLEVLSIAKCRWLSVPKYLPALPLLKKFDVSGYKIFFHPPLYAFQNLKHLISIMPQLQVIDFSANLDLRKNPTAMQCLVESCPLIE